MEHLIRIAFWIFTLSGSLQAIPLPDTLQATTLPDESDFRIELMRDSVTCLPDSRFYTPENVQEKCITTALDCITKELNGTAKVECDDPKGYINPTLKAFHHMMRIMDKDHGLTNSTDCVCERWRQTLFNEFLNKTNDLLNKIYSKEQ